MSLLEEQVAGFLIADGFKLNLDQEYILAKKTDNVEDAMLFWVTDSADEGFDPERLLSQFQSARTEHKKNQAYLIVPSLKGFSKDFTDIARQKHAIKILTAVQFFDTIYKDEATETFGGAIEAKKGAKTVFRNLYSQDVLKFRVHQPFHKKLNIAEDMDIETGDDLLESLLDDLATFPEKPLLRIVVGNAGAGKSIFFQALFTKLYDNFLQKKKSHIIAPRPIPFLPEHVQDHEEKINTMDDLVNAVIEADVAGAAGPTLFEWLHENGYATWLFDGLDEFYAESDDFFPWLEDSLEHGKSQILICVRDSLLTSSDKFVGFIENYIKKETKAQIDIYELTPWDHKARTTLAWLKLEGRLPEKPDAQSPRVEGFLTKIDRPEILELASLPYYCDLLLDQYQRKQDNLPEDEFELLDLALESLINREEKKVVFNWDVFIGREIYLRAMSVIDDEGAQKFQDFKEQQKLEKVLTDIGRDRLIELLGYLAHSLRCAVRYPAESGISVEDVKALGEVYTEFGISQQVEPRVIASLVHFAFFGPGAQEGTIKFTHELMADYIAGRYALNNIINHFKQADHIGQMIGIRDDFEQSLFARYLAKELKSNPECISAIQNHIETGAIKQKYRHNTQALLDLIAEA